MAIDPSSEYPGKITAPDANYDYGSAKPVSTPTAQDGTPWSLKLVNDFLGAQQKLLKLTGIIPSGNAETQLVSQYFQALSELMGRLDYGADAVNTDNYIVTTLNEAPSLKIGYRILLKATNANTGVCDVNPNALGVIDIKLPDGSDPLAGHIPAGEIVELIYDGTNFLILTNNVGQIIQIQENRDSSVATGTAVIPRDDTIPRQSGPAEGTQFISKSIIPTNANNILIIEGILYFSHDNAGGAHLLGGLFQDATALAIAGFHGPWTSPNESLGAVAFSFKMPAGTTLSTEFKVRVGPSGAGPTIRFNGVAGARLFGGVMASFIRIIEIKI